MRNRLRIAVVVLSGIYMPVRLNAQTHINTWFRMTGRYYFSEKWMTDIEWQHRRQQGYSSNNPFHNELLNSVRPWVYYSFNQNIRIDASPIAYYSLYSVIKNKEDAGKKPQSEFRSTLGVSFKQPVTKKLAIGSRIMTEYRNFSVGNDIVRGRARLSADYEINKHYKITLQGEELLNMSGTTPGHIFDHSRLSASVNKQFGKHYNVELGYIYISRLLPGDSFIRREHILFLNMIIDFKRNIKTSS
ncbi:MAG: DUF2490 domain-containing protein [Chitinophagaceae bacterium]|nr:DUF2490 domain-containing protein [Chitinophagaceae bacterium]